MRESSLGFKQDLERQCMPLFKNIEWSTYDGFINSVKSRELNELH
jgi:hypothetical protein